MLLKQEMLLHSWLSRLQPTVDAHQEDLSFKGVDDEPVMRSSRYHQCQCQQRVHTLTFPLVAHVAASAIDVKAGGLLNYHVVTTVDTTDGNGVVGSKQARSGPWSFQRCCGRAMVVLMMMMVGRYC
jgi:hypothetical protein